MTGSVLSKRWEQIALVGTLVTAAGSIPAWFTLTLDPELAALLGEPETVTRGGLGGDGILTIGLAILVAVVLLVVSYRSPRGAGRKTAALSILGGLGSAFLAVLAWIDFQDIQDTIAELEAGDAIETTVADAMTAEMNVSLYVVVLGSLLLVAGGLLGLVGGSEE